MIAFRCPSCAASVEAPDYKSGVTIACPRCGVAIQVPPHGAPQKPEKPGEGHPKSHVIPVVAPTEPPLPVPTAAPESALPSSFDEEPLPRSQMSVALLIVAGMFGGAVVVLTVLFLGGWLGSHHDDANRGALTVQTSGDGTEGKPGGSDAKATSTTPDPTSEKSAKSVTTVTTAPSVPEKSTPTASTTTGLVPAPIPHAPVADSPPTPKTETTANMRVVDGLHVTTVKLSPSFQPVLPCLVWADAGGSAFLVLERETGVLSRVSFPDLAVTKHKDLGRKFAWMSLSAEGVVLTETDSGKLWLLDPITLAEKRKIEVAGLQRAVSAPGISKAVATTRVKDFQGLFLIDLATGGVAEIVTTPFVSDDAKHTYIVDNVQAVKSVGRVQNPAVSPDGAFVFLEAVFVDPFHYSNPELTIHVQYRMIHRYVMFAKTVEGQTTTTLARTYGWGAPDGVDDRSPTAPCGFCFSADSRFVCLPIALGNFKDKPFTTAVFDVNHPVFTFTANSYLALAKLTIPSAYLTALLPLKDKVLTEDDLDREVTKVMGNEDAKRFIGTVKLFTRTITPQVQCSLDSGVGLQAVGFDVKAARIYAQDPRHELIVYTLHGVKQKEYVLNASSPESVLQYLVHPAGHKLLLLTERNLYLVELPPV